MQDVIVSESCPELNGIIQGTAERHGNTLMLTNTDYHHLTDMTPSNLDNKMTVICKAQSITGKYGQGFTVFQ